MFARAAAILAVLAAFAAGPAQAKTLAFTAMLSGDKMPTMTGSKATGSARILVDTDAQTIDMTMDVKGLKVDDLWTSLVAAPVGPVHLHRYGSHDHADPNSSALILPFPYGPDYTPTADGFRLVVKAYPYAKGAATVKTTATFDDFVAALQGGGIVLNIHTNAQHDGEISGDVVQAS
jgi:hypothetical protein